MVNYEELSRKFYRELVDIIGIDDRDVQILANHTLHLVDPTSLKFPRLIHGVLSYNSSDYDYMDMGYNSHTDNFDRNVRIIPRLMYQFRIYSDEKSSHKIFDIMNKIHNYYSNGYNNHLKGEIVVVRTAMIQNSLIQERDLASSGLSFTMDINMEELMTSNIEYADKFEIKSNLK